jgi:Kef-type K+ transport system membrane component KefB
VTVMLVILAAAAVSMGLARWLRLPLVPLLVLSGIAVSGLGLVTHPALFQQALLLGLTFLVFSAGVEMNPARVGRQAGVAFRVAIVQFVALGAAGFALAWLLGFDWLGALYVALALAASSTLVVIRLLKQRQQLFEPFGRLVVGVLLLQDGAIILAIAALSSIEEGVVAAVISVNATLGLMFLAYLSLKWLSPWLLLELDLDEEEKLLVALALLFLFAGLAYLIGVPLVIGAFLAGVALSVFPVSGILRGQLASLSDFFLALFFVTLGTILELPALNELLLALGLAAAVILLTPMLVRLVARRAGLTSRTALEGGLLLAQTSEFSLIVALLGVQQGHLEGPILSVIAIVTVVTMILTPFLGTDRVTLQLIHWRARWQRLAAPPAPEGHVLLLGCGEHGWPLLEWLQEERQEVVVVDEDTGVVERVRASGVPAIQGDAANPKILEAAGASQACAVVSTLHRLADNEAVLAHVRGVPVLVTVFEPAVAERLRALGAIPVLESHAAAEELLGWIADPQKHRV